MSDLISRGDLAPPAKGRRQPFEVNRVRPLTVRVSFWTLAAALVASVVWLIVHVVGFDWTAYLASEVHSFVRNGHQLEVTPALAIGTKVTGWALGLAGAVSQGALTLLMWRGLGWARIVLSVLGVLGLGTLLGDANLLAVVSSVVFAAAVLLLWLPPSNEFLRAVKADRRKHRSLQL